MNHDAVPVFVVGLTGFAARHLDLLRSEAIRDVAHLAGCYPHGYDLADPAVERIRSAGCSIYATYEQLLEEAARAGGLVVLPVPIHLHADMAIRALDAGAPVLCEKPLVATTADVARLWEAEDRAAGHLFVGFQHVYASPVQELKAVIAKGDLGALVRGKGLALWPRDASYYRRNEWAGRLTVNGTVVNDSPMQNANAHVLQNLLYLAGAGRHSAAGPTHVYAENYRAHDIESADTQAVRIRVDSSLGATVPEASARGRSQGGAEASDAARSQGGPEGSDAARSQGGAEASGAARSQGGAEASAPARSEGDPELLFLASHAVGNRFGPVIEMEFTNGRAIWRVEPDYSVYSAIAMNDGRTAHTRIAESTVYSHEYRSIVRSIRTGEPPLCGIGNARQHVAVVEQVFAAAPVRQVPEDHVARGALDGSVVISDLSTDAFLAFDQWKTFGELGSGWAGGG